MQKFYIYIFALHFLWLGTSCQSTSTKIVLEEPIYVLVHRDNPANKISKNELRRIYLGKKGHWNNAIRVEKYDYFPAKNDFYKKILEMSNADLTRHWNQQKHRAGSLRPQTIKTQEELFLLLGREKGAIAYVTSDDIPNHAKVIATFGK